MIYQTIPIHLRLPQYKRIEKIVDETEDVKTLFFRSSEIAEMFHPGQFLMVYVFNHITEEEIEEIPISISYINRNNNTVGISVRVVGVTTIALNNHIEGDLIGVRGPYGHGYNYDCIGNRIAIICGGIGIAPVMPLIEDLRRDGRNVDVFLGAQSKNHLCFVKRIEYTGANLYIATDDGSIGKKGFVTDLLEWKIKKQKYDSIITSGPELMMKKVLDISNKYGIPLQASLERYIKCGRGICGQCAIDDLCVCKDGPVFPCTILNRISDFGRFALDECGEHKSVGEIFKKGK